MLYIVRVGRGHVGVEIPQDKVSIIADFCKGIMYTAENLTEGMIKELTNPNKFKEGERESYVKAIDILLT